MSSGHAGARQSAPPLAEIGNLVVRTYRERFFAVSRVVGSGRLSGPMVVYGCSLNVEKPRFAYPGFIAEKR